MQRIPQSTTARRTGQTSITTAAGGIPVTKIGNTSGAGTTGGVVGGGGGMGGMIANMPGAGAVSGGSSVAGTGIAEARDGSGSVFHSSLGLVYWFML